ncbi:ropporin-1-like protein [Paramacrobiotus metropolitanus]|uniref:ropporin-1-like protein n=1 Tax=Paramacrobiotus metropolitanus TaxID=2943436 RepID=UPI0024463278|nr:ropporin-1-like protein [Paramacrobiotus metropolitanus]
MDPTNLVQLDEPFYTAEQIVVPPELPEILKQFTKAAIKTQPPDLLEWASSYFRARATGQRLPIKDRLELIPDDYDDLTLGLLKILHRELGHKNVVSLAEIQEHWTGLGLGPDKFTELVDVGNFPATVEWHRFVVIACGKLGEQIEDIFKNFCLVLTNEPDGSNALVPFSQFQDAYSFVAQTIEEIDDATQDHFLAYMNSVAEKQGGMVHPGNITYRDAPPMVAGPQSSRQGKRSTKRSMKGSVGRYGDTETSDSFTQGTTSSD